MRRGSLSGLARGTLRELVRQVEVPRTGGNGGILIRFDGKLKLPPNQGSSEVKTVGKRQISRKTSMDSVRVESGEFSFEVRIEGRHTVVSLSLPLSIDRNQAESRIQESLQFVLGMEIDPLVVETYFGDLETTKLLSANCSKRKGKIPPPVKIQSFDWDGHFWRLFSDYFKYVMTDVGIGWHPVSEHIGSAIESSAASLGSELLALSVAVEGISGIVCKSARLTEGLLRDLEKVTEALRRLEIADVTRNRIEGAMGGMKKPRNSDLLRDFVAATGLPFSLFESWTRLRHAAAHGVGLHERKIEDLLLLRDQVRMLFYSLIFHAVGYSGPRVDYAQEGWPETSWPVLT